MYRHHSGRHIAGISTRRIAAFAIAGIMMLQPLFASEPWARITKLKQGTWIYVLHSEVQRTQGTLVQADASGMVVRVSDKNEVKLERDLVLQVAVYQSGRKWYSLPLSIAAAVAGGFGGYEVVKRTTCSDPRRSCGKAKGVIIGISVAGPAVATYKLTKSKSGLKVIYEKGR